jgi:hypothetical protein
MGRGSCRGQNALAFQMHRCAKNLSGLLCGTFYGLRVVLSSPSADHGGHAWSLYKAGAA